MDKSSALRAGRITLDESRQILRVSEAGLAGYLEREVDAKSFTASQLRLVVPNDVPRDQRAISARARRAER